MPPLATLTLRCSADANKHWNGLVRDFYQQRVQCFVDQASIDLPASAPTTLPEHSPFDGVNMTKCAVMAELAFTQGTETTYAETPTSSKTLSMSKALLAKYAKYFN